MNPTGAKFCLTALAIALTLSGTACKQQNSAETLPLPVHTAMVQTIAVGNGAKYSASIVPYAQVDLAFQSGGYVESIRQVKSPGGGMRNIDQGDWVKKGTVNSTMYTQASVLRTMELILGMRPMTTYDAGANLGNRTEPVAAVDAQVRERHRIEVGILVEGPQQPLDRTAFPALAPACPALHR